MPMLFRLQFLVRRYGHPARLPLLPLHPAAGGQKESGHPQVGQEMAGYAGSGESGLSAAERQIGNELVSQIGIEGGTARKVLQEFPGRLGADRLRPLAPGAEGGESGPGVARISLQKQKGTLPRTRRIEKSDIRRRE